MINRWLPTFALACCLSVSLWQAPNVRAASTEAPSKVILDTDIGDDIDDAYALVLLASLPRVRLLGVTTGYGQTRERAQVAAKLLQTMGRGDVPVLAGRRGDNPIREQYQWARNFSSKAIKSEAAVEWMRRQIERAPGQITIIGIGPLMNVADLLSRYPTIKPKIKRIVIMGGSVYRGYNNAPPAEPEWNIRVDPAAARIVFNSGVPIVMAGLEVTTMMKFDIERQKQIYAFGTPATDALAALTILWGNGTPTLFDAVAIAQALGYSFSQSEMRRVQVEDNGLTRIMDGPPNTTVLIDPRPEEFLNWFVAALKPKSASNTR